MIWKDSKRLKKYFVMLLYLIRIIREYGIRLLSVVRNRGIMRRPSVVMIMRWN
jgi:hypothetical protein